MKGSYHCDGSLDVLCKHIAEWRENKGFETSWHNVPEKLMLVVTELSEAMEAYRHLPPKTLVDLSGGVALTPADTPILVVINFEEELADAAIRLFDLAGSLGIDLETAIAHKMDKNEERPTRHGKER